MLGQLAEMEYKAKKISDWRVGVYEEYMKRVWMDIWKEFRDLSICAPPPPSLVGIYYLHPPDARAIFLYNDLLCNGKCSVIGVAKRTGGAQTEKIRI